MMRDVIRACRIVRARIANAAQHMETPARDGDDAVAVNDAFGSESRQPCELARSLDGRDEQGTDLAMPRDGAEAGAARFEQARRAGGDELPGQGSGLVEGWHHFWRDTR